MTKIYGLLVAAVVAVGFSAPANAEVLGIRDLQVATKSMALTTGLNWNVGDKATYSLDIGGFIKGSSVNSVTQDTGTGFWMVEDMDLMIQKQKVEILINKTTGEIEKLLVNGQEQSIPKSDVEIVEMKEDHISVPAGSFDCIYAKIKDKSSGDISEAWINPQLIPMTGALKELADSQLGKVTQELKSFSFAHP